MNTRVVFTIVCFGLVILASGCTTVEPPVPVPAAPPCELSPGASTALTATGAEGANSLEWSASIGQLTPNKGPAVTYTAPRDYSGPVVITVIAKKGSAQAQGQMTCIVLQPPPTLTPEPTATLPPTPTSTSTAAPLPIVCNHPSVTKDLFPQLQDVSGQFSMYGPEGDPNILCQAVYDIVHTPGKMAVHFKYTNVGTNFGWWGIAINDPNSYDAAQHRQLCFWVYAQQPHQSFRVKMKDKSVPEKKEAGVVVITQATNEWEQICTNISDFADAGIQVEKMDNINLGFEQPSGSAEIWIADFEFR